MTFIRGNKSGFTLIELLVVMGISVILMGLVLGPVVQSFNLTRRAKAMVEAQDAARITMEQIARELGQAMMVYDNATDPIELPVRQADGSIQAFPLPYARIDFVLPKSQMHCNSPDHPDGVSRDFPREDPDGLVLAWPRCPADGSDDVELRPFLPLEPDSRVVRYFLGLRYNDPNSPRFGWKSGWDNEIPVGEDNPVVLYRVEFDPNDDSLFPAEMSEGERLADPGFFYRDGYAEKWAEIARIVGIGRYQDLVQATYGAPEQVTAVQPCITFRAEAIENDAFAPVLAGGEKFEYPNAPPVVCYASFGHWGKDYRVDIFRDDYKIRYTAFVNSAGHLIVARVIPPTDDGTLYQTFDYTDYLQTGAISGQSNPENAEGYTEMAFEVDTKSGLLNFALDPPTPTGNRDDPVSIHDPAEINRRFHEVYQGLVAGSLPDRSAARRWVLLSTFDSTSPNYLGRYVDSKGVERPRAHVVPGSEEVEGPNMTPGVNYGKPVRYERVPWSLAEPGLNQYKIDYEFGVVQFTSVYDQDLPEVVGPDGQRVPIKVDYKVQFNRADDVIRGNYDTFGLINIRLEIRMYDPESGKPHPVSLTNTVTVRNAQR